MSGVAPSPPGASTAAPPSNKARAAATWPRSAATCKARSPFDAAASAGHFCASKAAIRSPSLFSARQRGTVPFSCLGGLERRSELGGTAITAPRPAASRRSAPRFRSKAAQAARFEAVARPRAPTHHINARGALVGRVRVRVTLEQCGDAGRRESRRTPPRVQDSFWRPSRRRFPALGDQRTQHVDVRARCRGDDGLVRRRTAAQ